MSSDEEPLGCTPQRLAWLLQQVALIDARCSANLPHEDDYEERSRLLVAAETVAHELRYAHGYRIDEKYPEWPLLFIRLPTGQISYHMPCFSEEWDQHTTEEKYRRIEAFIASVREPTVSDG